MKKLMIAAAIVCAAAFAQAATYNWAASCEYIVDNSAASTGGYLNSGLAVYVFDANVVNRGDLLTALAGGTLTGLDDALLTVDGERFALTQDFGNFGAGGKGDWNGAQEGHPVGLSAVEGKGSAFYVIFNDADATKASQFLAGDILPDIDCTGNVTSMGDDAFVGFPAVDVAGEWTAINAPEPTSGLLLLLGVAGLALKRRRA